MAVCQSSCWFTSLASWYATAKKMKGQVERFKNWMQIHFKYSLVTGVQVPAETEEDLSFVGLVYSVRCHFISIPEYKGMRHPDTTMTNEVRPHGPIPSEKENLGECLSTHDRCMSRFSFAFSSVWRIISKMTGSDSILQNTSDLCFGEYDFNTNTQHLCLY